MKSARTIRILILASMMAPATVVRGDTFFDFGLRWTQWVPNQGKIQKFEREEVPTLIAVPKPTEAEVKPVVQEPLNNQNSTGSDPGQNFVSKPGYSAPSTYVPITNTPVSVPITPVVSAPPVPVAPSIPTPPPVSPNVYPVSTPPAANSGNVFPVSMPPAANYGTPPVVSSQDRYDALIRMDGGPFPLSDKLVTGDSQAWYNSPVVQSLYGGMPSDSQKQTFENDVLDKVRSTYANSGISLNLTNDPTAAAARTISVVAGAGYGENDKVAGITVMNGDGFSFIDKLDKAASIDDLEWAVARNVAHEMLHAFNVGHHDTSGNYLDAAVANWDMLIGPDTKFSDDAIADLRTQIAGGIIDSPIMGIGNFGQHVEGSVLCAHCLAAQTLDIQPVPEPTTIALWLAGAGILFRFHRNRTKTA
jgi:hypothetical protein